MTKGKDLLLIVIVIILALISTIANLGWLRLLFRIPVLIYFLANIFIHAVYRLQMEEVLHKGLKQRFYWGLLSFLFVNSLCPDADDVKTYAFFHQSTNEGVVSLCQGSAPMSLS